MYIGALMVAIISAGNANQCYSTNPSPGIQEDITGPEVCTQVGSTCNGNRTVTTAPAGPKCERSATGLAGCTQASVRVNQTTKEQECVLEQGTCVWKTQNTRTVEITAYGQKAAGSACPAPTPPSGNPE